MLAFRHDSMLGAVWCVWQREVYAVLCAYIGLPNGRSEPGDVSGDFLSGAFLSVAEDTQCSAWQSSK